MTRCSAAAATKVWAAAWFHDGSAQGPRKTGRGNNWVIAAIVVGLSFTSLPVALPALAKPVVNGTNSASRLRLARRMTQMIAATLPGRDVHIVTDAAYAGNEPKKPGPQAPACRQPGRPPAQQFRQNLPVESRTAAGVIGGSPESVETS